MKKQYYFLFIAFLCVGVIGDTLAQMKAVSLSGLRARSIGPAVMSGRVTDIDVVHSDPNIIYLASASGGVWKSASGGTTFRPIFDEHTMSIGNIAVDQNHPDTVWVGTGEPWVRNSVSMGTGVYVTINGGTSWQFKGLPDSERISNIQIDPNDPNTIYVAVQGHLWNANEERGVYKTTDFGTTWEKVLYVDENTGCADLAIDPKNPDILYAAMWEHRRTPSFFNSGGMGSGLYKTTDAGKTWTKIHNGLPQGKFGRFGIGLAPSNPDVIYLSVECENKDKKGLYKTTDAGANWKLISQDFNTTVRPFYFSRIVVDPSDENKVYKCGLNTIVSKDGGESFRSIGSGVHSDVHAVWVNPANSKHVLLGTDGGGYRSLDGAYTFEMFMDLPLSQFYHVSVDDAEPYNIYGGLQDNGSWVGPSKGTGGIQNKDWDFLNGGDGFFVVRHPTDENIVYAESQGGNLVRVNLKSGDTKDIKPLEEEDDPKYRFNWNTPIYTSPNNPEKLYYGAQFLFLSKNRGDTWTKISPDLTTNDPSKQQQKKSGGLSIDNSTAENNTTIYAIAESPKDENIIWVGTDDGNLQMSSNAGKKWTNTALNIEGLPKNAWCTSIEPSHFDKNTCYVTFDVHKQGDKAPYVYKTTDLGETWTSIVTDDIEGYALCIREDLEADNVLFLGTEFGLYISLSGGATWKRFKNNLPKVGVRAMVIHPREHSLVMGTHGRGVYVIDDIRPIRQITPDIVDKTLHFFEQEPSVLSSGGGFGGAWFGGAGNFIGENPSEGASIAYYMKRRHTFGKMIIEVYDAEGKFIRDLPAGKSAGLNIVELPIRLPNPKAAPTNNRMALFGSIFPPTIPAGTYTIKVKKGKETFEKQVELIPDPKSEHSAADVELRYNAVMALYNITNQLGYRYRSLESMHDQAKALAAKGSSKLTKLLNTFAEDAQKFKETLVSLEGDFYVDEGEAIREEISTLYLGINQYPGKPSDSQLRKLEVVRKKMAEVNKKYDVFRSRMNGLNVKLEKSEMDKIVLKSFEEYMK